ncbi:MAG: UDP-N-acetylmuramoyl-tripeptide--D-alanyl-D-alanine ligase, partial [Bacteroidota bacterium]
LQALQQLANHHRRQLRMPILAITGSNGKTTTKELVAAVMSRHYRIHFTQGNLNNHIGVPLTLLQIGEEVEMAIIEMGANHQGEIAALCQIAEPTHGLITNIGDAHLEGFGGIEGVKKGKGELYDYLVVTGGVAFVNLDAEHLPQMAEKLTKRINYCHSDQPSPTEPAMEIQLLRTAPDVSVAFLDETGQLQRADTNLPGGHNFENIKAAVAIGKYFKVPVLKIAAGLEAYQSTNNRSQRLTYQGVDFLLDAYNANPSSTKAALHAFVEVTTEPRIAILGEMLELGEETKNAHRTIAELASRMSLEQLILVGKGYAEATTQYPSLHFPEVEALKDWFWKQDWMGYTVLVKGSRAVGLERLLE